MITLNPQYLTDEHNHRKAVVIPLAEWERILEALEKIEDVLAFDRAKAGSIAPQRLNEVKFITQGALSNVQRLRFYQGLLGPTD